MRLWIWLTAPPNQLGDSNFEMLVLSCGFRDSGFGFGSWGCGVTSRMLDWRVETGVHTTNFGVKREFAQLSSPPTTFGGPHPSLISSSVNSHANLDGAIKSSSQIYCCHGRVELPKAYICSQLRKLPVVAKIATVSPLNTHIRPNAALSTPDRYETQKKASSFGVRV